MMNNQKVTLAISEIFPSIQGEGRYLGYPSIFIRTSGCNLRCQWGDTRCDTPYTSWHPKSSLLSVPQIMAEVHRLCSLHPNICHIIVTGGEPLLQNHLDFLLSELSRKGFFLSLETNGTIANVLPVDFVSISPKLRTSVPISSPFEQLHEGQRYQKEVISFWCTRYDYQLKFVLDKEEDESEILAILEDIGYIPKRNVYLMPQGVTKEQLQKNAKKCISLVLKHGWNFSPRAHIEVYGDTRKT